MFVYGKNVAKELINNKRKIKIAYLLNSYENNDMDLLFKKANVNVQYVDRKKLDKMVDKNHQGIILEIDDYKYLSEKEMLETLGDNPFIVLLDHIEDPHNFGAIIRTCEAAGVDYIIIPKNRSVGVNSTVMKTSTGALDNVNIVQITNINQTIEKLKKKGVWIVGTDMENSSVYDELDYKIPICIIIGSEGFGMSNLVKKNCDFIARIPMYGKINSLNASVAAGIMIYEVVRQRK